MYLVPAEKYSEAPKKHSPPISEDPQHTQSLSPQPPHKKKTKKKKTKKKKTKKQKRHPYEKWVKYCKKMREDEMRRMTQMHAIADYSQKVLLVRPTTPPTPAIAKAPPPPPPTTRRLAFGPQTKPEKKKKQTVPPPQPSTSMAETFASTPKSSFAEISDDDDDDDDDDNVFVEEDAQAFGRENVGPIASPYIVPYLYNRRYLDTQYGLRKDGDSFKIGDSAVLVDPDSNITIKGREFRGTTGLWELLTRKNVDRKHVTTDDLKKI